MQTPYWVQEVWLIVQTKKSARSTGHGGAKKREKRKRGQTIIFRLMEEDESRTKSDQGGWGGKRKSIKIKPAPTPGMRLLKRGTTGSKRAVVTAWGHALVFGRRFTGEGLQLGRGGDEDKSEELVTHQLWAKRRKYPIWALPIKAHGISTTRDGKEKENKTPKGRGGRVVGEQGGYQTRVKAKGTKRGADKCYKSRERNTIHTKQ